MTDITNHSHPAGITPGLPVTPHVSKGFIEVIEAGLDIAAIEDMSFRQLAALHEQLARIGKPIDQITIGKFRSLIQEVRK